jgi:hypothetical protein
MSASPPSPAVVMLVFWAPLGIWLGMGRGAALGLREWGCWCQRRAALRLLRRAAARLPQGRPHRGVSAGAGLGPLLSSLAASAAGRADFRARAARYRRRGGRRVSDRRRAGPVARLARPGAAQRVRKGMVYGLLSGAFIASYTVVDGYAVKVLLMSPILVDYVGNLLRMLVLAPAVLRDVPEAALLWRGNGSTRCSSASSARCPMCWCCTPCRPRRCRTWRPRARCPMLFAALIGGHLLGEGDRAAAPGRRRLHRGGRDGAGAGLSFAVIDAA